MDTNPQTTPNHLLNKLATPIRQYRWAILLTAIIIAIATALHLRTQSQHSIEVDQLQQHRQTLAQEQQDILAVLAQTQLELEQLQNEDQFLRNEELEAEIASIEQAYTSAVESYDQLLKLNLTGTQAQPLQTLFTQIVTKLSDRDYSSALEDLSELNQNIETILAQRAAAAATPPPAPPPEVPSIQEAPDSGYRRQSVTIDNGTFQVDIIAADLNSTRVLVETASESDCANDCPVTNLADYVSRAGAYAGINGPYFCPAEYPSCAGKTNSFDTLLMNRHKHYFNSDNNVHSTVPAVIFSGNSARFVGQTLEWGRDTGVDAVIAGRPLLLSGGEIRFTGGGDASFGVRSGRSFIGTRDHMVYIGVVRNATVADSAQVLKAMGLRYALNLDAGGSTALYLNGRYLAGPGRNTPFGIVLVRK